MMRAILACGTVGPPSAASAPGESIPPGSASAARNLEQTEKDEHAENRIIAIRESGNEMLITTTDVHLPRRIGKAIEQAFEGKLDIHFDKDGYFTSITWHRDA